MRFRWDKKYLYWGVTAFCVIAASIVFFLILSKISAIKGFFGIILKVIKPVLYGLLFAYLMNPLVKTFERPILVQWGEKIYGKDSRKSRSFARCIAILLALVLVLLIVIGLLWLVLPRLYESIQTLVTNLPLYFDRMRSTVEEIFKANQDVEDYVLGLFDNLSQTLSSFLSGDLVNELKTVLVSITSSVYAVVMEIVYIAIGFIVAVYILTSKERFAAQTKKVLYSIFDVQHATDIIEEAHEVNEIFIGFVSGKILDSLIIGVICYISLNIIQMPYKELVSVIVGVTNVIPFFGPFIGAVPSAFLILLVDPFKCLIFVIYILILQQIDGNIIGPKILGQNTGLSSFWVICAILVGGGLFGFAGMLFGVPVFAVIYRSVKRAVEHSLKKKDVPVKTSDFLKIAYLDPVTGEPVSLETVAREKEQKKAEEQKKEQTKIQRKKNTK
ncbi:AI-2E family transporter [Lachnospiraceae bacterium CLA-AA-H215]|uniref:AI-2E family transporter n=1 Tax=Hominifimenecus microfluidus TaxID=2885348 RepID=A0AAE3E9I8_9FIRM|nr:AI-2E family transporter [Hominifimenecus microfluidus]MCC2231017.1 AI-2E family transporter [Hominifimenecus microfluidus]